MWLDARPLPKLGRLLGQMVKLYWNINLKHKQNWLFVAWKILVSSKLNQWNVVMIWMSMRSRWFLQPNIHWAKLQVAQQHTTHITTCKSESKVYQWSLQCGWLWWHCGRRGCPIEPRYSWASYYSLWKCHMNDNFFNSIIHLYKLLLMSCDAQKHFWDNNNQSLHNLICISKSFFLLPPFQTTLIITTRSHRSQCRCSANPNPARTSRLYNCTSPIGINMDKQACCFENPLFGMNVIHGVGSTIKSTGIISLIFEPMVDCTSPTENLRCHCARHVLCTVSAS